MFGAFAAVSVQQVGESLFTRAGERTDAAVMSAIEQFDAMLESADARGLTEAARDFCVRRDMRVIITDEAGNVVTDSESALNGTRYVYANGVYATARIDSGFETPASLIRSYVLTSGRLFVLTELSSEYGTVKNAAIKMCCVAAVLYIMCAFAVLSAITRFTRPLAGINEGIKRVSAGDFTTRVNTEGMEKEFKTLAEAFNDMMTRVETLDRSRNSFVSNASHELKTPLATMKVMIESVLYMEVLDEAITKEFLVDANNEIDRLNSIITDLLSLVGMDSGENKLKIAALDLPSLLKENIKRLLPLARERGLDLSLSSGVDKLEVEADSARLTEVFYNLMDNALKYTPRPGKVTVELNRSGRNAVVRVSDTGIGISEEDQKHIFDRFYRVDKARSRATGGTGLGLSIVKQIILQHNGNISVASEPDKGTTFTVTLPLKQKRGAE